MRAIPGWMCAVDFQHELGEALGGNTIYPSEKDLRKRRVCVNSENEEDKFCYPVEVVTMSKEDFDRLVALSGIDPRGITSSNIGPAIWTKEEGLLK
jgi:hypothetical protein